MALTRVAALDELRGSSYERHALHQEGLAWVEKNCYGDLWIELLHALGHEPLAILPFTLAVDFLGDQWTFFKPPLAELRELYGIDVQELTVWRPLVDHAVEHLGAGRLVSTEADSFWLPDTTGTDYRAHHVKTTIALAMIDTERRRLGYFHNAGYFELDGADYVGALRLDVERHSANLPLFAELVRVDRQVFRSPVELAAMSMQLLRRHLQWRPASNPFKRFGDRLANDLRELQSLGLDEYHQWAFAGIRQAGAAFELAAANLRWLAGFGHAGLLPAADEFDAIAQANKALILKGARAVNSKRELDATALLDTLAGSWDRGMAVLVRNVSGAAP